MSEWIENTGSVCPADDAMVLVKIADGRQFSDEPKPGYYFDFKAKNAEGKFKISAFKYVGGTLKETLHKKVHKEPVILPPENPVNRPPHYTNHPSGIECIEITRHMNFNLGNAMKYIWRAARRANFWKIFRKLLGI